MLNINEIEVIVTSIVKSVSNDTLMPYFSKVQAQNSLNVKADGSLNVKADGSLITQADIDVQDLIKSQLLTHFPHYGFFAEELPEQQLRLFFSQNHSGFWCLDPIDGTSNFAATLPYFSISLALIINGETIFGLVYDPVRDECFTAIKDAGAKLNGQIIYPPKAPDKLSECLAIVDFKRLSKELRTKLVCQPPYRSQRSFGSVALDWCWLAMGRGQLYVHGKQMLWDYAAGLLIAHESGCSSCTMDGGSVFQQSLEPRQVIASSRNNLQKQWLEFITS